MAASNETTPADAEQEAAANPPGQSNHDDNNQRRQCVWIIRYGLTEFPLVESVGPFDSDIDPTEGIDHANCIAKRIASCPDSDVPTLIYSSPFLRTAHTAHILSKHLSDATSAAVTTADADNASTVVPVRIEEGLTEWLTPSLLVEPNGRKTEPRSLAQLRQLFDSIDDTYRSVNPVIPHTVPKASAPEGSPHFIETEQDLLKRCAKTITRILDRIETTPRQRNIAIVSHAPCDQAVALALERARSVQESKLGPWPLGGITVFSRTRNEERKEEGEWKLELYGDTSHMPGKYRPGIKEWSLPCLTRAK